VSEKMDIPAGTFISNIILGFCNQLEDSFVNDVVNTFKEAGLECKAVEYAFVDDYFLGGAVWLQELLDPAQRITCQRQSSNRRRRVSE